MVFRGVASIGIPGTRSHPCHEFARSLRRGSRDPVAAGVFGQRRIIACCAQIRAGRASARTRQPSPPIFGGEPWPGRPSRRETPSANKRCRTGFPHSPPVLPPGTRIIYDRKFLLDRRNSPMAKTPPCHLPNIPGVTSPGEAGEEPKADTNNLNHQEGKPSMGKGPAG